MKDQITPHSRSGNRELGLELLECVEGVDEKQVCRLRVGVARSSSRNEKSTPCSCASRSSSATSGRRHQS